MEQKLGLIIENKKEKLKPMFKWVGGKGKEIPVFKKYIPSYDIYIEPFVGGGAVYFYLNSNKNVINDINKELVIFCNSIKQEKKQRNL